MRRIYRIENVDIEIYISIYLIIIIKEQPPQWEMVFL